MDHGDEEGTPCTRIRSMVKWQSDGTHVVVLEDGCVQAAQAVVRVGNGGMGGRVVRRQHHGLLEVVQGPVVVAAG